MSDVDHAPKPMRLSDYRLFPWLLSLGLALICGAIVWLVVSLLP